MQDIINSIKEDTAFNKSDLEAAQQRAVDRIELFEALQGTFPMMLEELNVKLSEGYVIAPMHMWNHQKAGFLQIALRKPDSLIKTEQTQARAQAKANYQENLARRKEALIADYVDRILAEERAAEVERLRSEEEAKSQAIKAQLLAGLS